MVAEACSGIHSLFSCVCVMVFVSVALRYRLIRILTNILQTVLWVIAANALRVFLVVYSYSVWELEIDSGWRHDALGIFTYAVALLMSLSTDRLLSFLVPVSPTGEEEDGVVYGLYTNTFSRMVASGSKAAEITNQFLDAARLSCLLYTSPSPRD